MCDKVKILKRAKEILLTKNDNPNKDVHFMCVAIEIAFVEFGGDPKLKLKGIQIIPEMLEFKPDGIDDDSAWFGIKESDMKKRIEIIDELIKILN